MDNLISFSDINRSGRESDSDAEDIEHAEKLRQVKAVLEEVLSVENIYHCFLFVKTSVFG